MLPIENPLYCCICKHWKVANKEKTKGLCTKHNRIKSYDHPICIDYIEEDNLKQNEPVALFKPIPEGEIL